MAVDRETKKATLVAKAQALAGARLDPRQQQSAAVAIALFWEHVPPADIARRNPRDLCGAALSLWRFAERRRPGRAKIRIHNPQPADEGWASPHTIVEIINDDMPFLVDSVTGAINASDRVVHLVIHPIVAVSRDAGGRLVAIDGEIGDAAASASRESWMQLEITAAGGPDDITRLTESLSLVLADVRAAVEDWPKMRQALRALVDELTATPPQLPPGELTEVGDFLRWLDDDNFTFLGYREYSFDAAAAPDRPALGILRDGSYPVFGGLRDLSSLPPDVQDFVRRRELLVITKSNQRATVHRTAHMDAIGLRRFGPQGEVVGVRLFLGLFTSLAYSRSPRSIPLLRLKVRRLLARSGLSPASHDGKALLHILDNLPRDELFQIAEDELYDTAIGILNLQERQRIALFVRRDPLQRFVSCLVYVPRERYDTALRQAFAAILEEAFRGGVAAFYTHLDESVLARVQFIVRTTRGAVPAVDTAALEQRLAEAGRSWTDRLAEAAPAALGDERAQAVLRRIKAFPVAYQARTEAAQAVADLDHVEKVLDGAPLVVSLYPHGDDAMPGLRLYRATEPVALSDVLPILENLGLRVIAEEPFRLDGIAGAAIWIQEFHLGGAARGAVPTAVRGRFEEALLAVWLGRVENDGFNRLVLAAGLSARQAALLRLYAKILRQAGFAFSQAYIEDTLAAQPAIAARLVRLFELRLDPAHPGHRSLAVVAEVQAIDHALDAVTSLDEDRILRAYLALVLKTLRTNYYQRLPNGDAKPYLAVKLASSEVELLPRPRPLYEIYVYSPRVEGIHLRAGKVARGGIRWSDRKEDFRTEILGLMKAQTVKNVVIVPVGSKGGFVVKQPPAARERLPAEALECYRTLIRGLLDLSDNILSDEAGDGHRIVPPPDVVRHDGDDPYLVVAADKGTATFSDDANAIAAEYGFWLGDAFASGGSAGYDHKAMGITSKGAWEQVKRHFRELGRNAETEAITLVGVGDMSGDVFGNGLLLSRRFRLLAAFDHRHIFLDPDPDPESSFAERARLFHLPRSSWADYDRALISAGGGVFERSLKAVPVSPEVKHAFDVAEDHLTPAELIRHLLKARVDLIWFGGIGTYVKAPEESHGEAGDRADDALRVNGGELRALVVAEGANLAVTERGRVAYALAGGRIDTDAIDNSAGVDTSDHEVNLKILLDRAIATGALPQAEREPLLAGMAEEVAAAVLRDNYLQGQALSVAAARGPAFLDRQVRMMQELEREGRLDRTLEFLPDDATLAARATAHRGLVRPELCVLLAYAKMALDDALVASDLPDAPEMAAALRAYFPVAARDRLAPQIAQHPLRREITATAIANDLVNRAGITFAHDLRARTGRPPPEIARAYVIVRDCYALPDRWAEIEALDNQVAAAVQTGMLLDIRDLVEHAAVWLLRAGRLDIAAETARFGPAVQHLAAIVAELLPPGERALFDQRTGRLAAAGVPQPLAMRIGGIIFLTTAFEVADLAARTETAPDTAARSYYAVGARFALDELRDTARRLPAETPWQKAAVDTVIDDFYALQSDVAARVLSAAASDPDPLAAWSEPRARQLAPAETLAADLRAAATPDLAMLVVAARQLRQALG